MLIFVNHFDHAAFKLLQKQVELNLFLIFWQKIFIKFIKIRIIPLLCFLLCFINFIKKINKTLKINFIMINLY